MPALPLPDLANADKSFAQVEALLKEFFGARVMSEDMNELASMLVDKSLSSNERVDAARTLLEMDPDTFLKVTLRIAEDAGESSAFLKTAGSLLGEFDSSRRALTEFELRNISKEAYDAFCEYGL